MGHILLSLMAPKSRKPSGSTLVPPEPILGVIDLTPYSDDPTGGDDGLVSEISTSVSLANKQYTVSIGGGERLTVTRWDDPSEPGFVRQERLGGFDTTSIDSSGDLVAVALTPVDYADPANGEFPPRSVVRIYRINPAARLKLLGEVETGFLTDDVQFFGDGNQLLAVNEGQPNDDYSFDPEGSVSIITTSGKGGNFSLSVKPVGFDDIDLNDDRVIGDVRFSGSDDATSSLAQDLEPEYGAVLNGHGYVTLQENNAVAKIDLAAATMEKIFGLGAVDYARVAVDLSDNDKFDPEPDQQVLGLRMPDQIAAFTASDGEDYFITANEGDAREYEGYADEIRNKDLENPYELPDRLKLIANGNDPTQVLVNDGLTAFSFDNNSDGADGTPYSFGSRSASIFSAADGSLIWDSWMTDTISGVAYNTSLQNIAAYAGVYPNGRSDDKGTEPEAVALTNFQGQTYAVVGLERTTDGADGGGLLVVYNITNVRDVDFVTYQLLDGFAPEGIEVIPPSLSATGRLLLGVSTESTSNRVQQIDFEAMIGNGLGEAYLASDFATDLLTYPTLPPL